MLTLTLVQAFCFHDQNPSLKKEKERVIFSQLIRKRWLLIWDKRFLGPHGADATKNQLFMLLKRRANCNNCPQREAEWASIVLLLLLKADTEKDLDTNRAHISIPIM